MASSVPQKEIELKEDFLTCNFCSLPYDNESRQAKSLPCFHTYCKSCLEEQALLYKGAKFNCPVCAYEVTLPRGTVDTLPNDFMVENVKESRDLLESELSCGSCHDEGNQAVCFCHNCKKFLCENCVDRHKDMESQAEHKLSTIVELKNSKCNLVRQNQCERHTTQDLTLLCGRCNVPICDACAQDYHTECNFIDLKSVVADAAYSLQALSAISRIRRHDLIEKRATVEALQEKLTEFFNKSEEDMHACEEKLIIMIRSRYSIAHCNLKHLYKTKMTPLTTSLDAIDSLVAQITRACEVADQASNLSSPTQLLTLRNQIMGRFDDLKTAVGLLPEIKSDAETEIGFTAKHDRAMRRIDKLLGNVGDVGVSGEKSWCCPKLSTGVLIIGCILIACPLKRHIVALFRK